jgi:hypothetical protein
MTRHIKTRDNGVMVIYDAFGASKKPWWRAPFDGCFGNRPQPSLSSWIVVYPEWML